MAQIDVRERISATEAAEELETTHLRVLMLIKEGALDGIQAGEEWFITRKSLECFQSHGGNAQAQITCRTACGGNCGNH
jgi:hypothetical protein